MNCNELRLCGRRGAKVDSVASLGLDHIMRLYCSHVCWLCIESIDTASHVLTIVSQNEEREKGENPRRCRAQEFESFTCPIFSELICNVPFSTSALWPLRDNDLGCRRWENSLSLRTDLNSFRPAHPCLVAGYFI